MRCNRRADTRSSTGDVPRRSDPKPGPEAELDVVRRSFGGLEVELRGLLMSALASKRIGAVRDRV